MKTRKTLSLVLALCLCAGLLVVPASAAEFSRSKTYTPGQFTDVADSAWYAGSVKDCFELGLMSGSSADSFNPTGMFTLAEAATIAARMHNLYAGGNGVMPPSTGAWYQSAVDYCVKNGIFGAEEFDSFTRNATRAEMAGIMAKALPDSAWEAKNSVTALPDVNQATDYSGAIFKLYDAGVFTGSDDYGMFQPYANITRAEVAAIVARCADHSQRKTLALKPLSQREAPAIIGGYNKNNKMSNGRLAFRDPDTGKYGYLDGNGNVAIPAQYDTAKDFKDGYAVVEAGDKYGMIDVNGNVTVPIEYGGIYAVANLYYAYNNDYGLIVNGHLVTPFKYYPSPEYLGDGLYWVCTNSHYGVVNSAGQEIIPCQYGNITYNGLYCICSTGNKYDIYNTSGQLLATYNSDGIWYAKNSQLLAIKEGNKLAVVSVYGKITEAIYDNVQLPENANIAYVSIGNQWGVVGLNGVVLPTECNKWQAWVIASIAKGDYFTMPDDNGYKMKYIKRVDGTTVELSQTLTFSATYDRLAVAPDGQAFRFHYTSNNTFYYIDADGTVYEKYNAPKDLLAKFGDGPKKAVPRYAITSQNGKPYVAYGNDADGWTPVIEYYKNGLYYDEIQDIGEGYYACLYNTTWYLVHAD